MLDSKFTNEVFLTFRDFIHKNYGIYYADVKKDLLSIKLKRCLIKSGLSSYDEYFKLICSDDSCDCSIHFVDEITVNKTGFFREMEHYDFIRSKIDYIYSSNANIVKNKEIKVWSMACSTGQEPYTIAMVLNETMPQTFKKKILATDVSSKVLKVSKEGMYPKDIKNEIEPLYLEKYFLKFENHYKLREEIKDLITFRQFNLMKPFPFSGEFDIIFCRNVMIYFNLETQKQLLEKIYNCLAPGGLLIIGQAESILNKNHNFRHIASTIYIK